jgi:hypothetical protein
MKTRTKVLSKITATHEDIPLMDIIRMINEARGDRSIEEVINRNIRVRIERDEVHLGREEDCTTVFGMKVLSDEPMTEEEIEDERLSQFF